MNSIELIEKHTANSNPLRNVHLNEEEREETELRRYVKYLAEVSSVLKEVNGGVECVGSGRIWRKREKERRWG